MNSKGSGCEIDLLYQITETLFTERHDLETVLNSVLGHLAAYGMERGIITIYDRSTNAARVEAAHSLTPAQLESIRYKAGEGIIGKVIERKKPALIESINDEPHFLDRTGTRGKLDRRKIAFICVPVMTDTDQVVGTLSVDRNFMPDISLDEDLRLLTVIAKIIGDAVRNRRDHMEELERMRVEMVHLENLNRGKNYSPSHIIGASSRMQEVFRLIQQVGPFKTTVLIRGESGTGKELVARAIHDTGDLKGAPFVAVNCGSLPENLVDSELFGHIRGAYTGAERARKGKFELAAGGTIFLDEIGELPASCQVKILRVLQEGQVDRLGDEKTTNVDVRVIAATNRNLEAAVMNGAFREDLYYRLNVFPVFLPPLRERSSDIALLADHFIEKYSKLQEKAVVRISTSAIDLMMSYHWPGNIRELENCIERAVLLATDGVIRQHHLPPTLQTGRSSGTTKSGSFEDMMTAYEKEILIEAMKNADGNITRAARALDSTQRILSYRLKRIGIHSELIKPKRSTTQTTEFE
ncbi:MAG: sigma 54-interacting transcriptional regulator [Planctomycetota bacterium]|nr:sigma 54-interacting transcriptional regulator [Planctomycetota bacterium]MDA1142748.1 sigma 54-interacting transcriptional regulator [Planctomycetota bacterium]